MPFSAGLEAPALRQAGMPAATTPGIGKKSLAKGVLQAIKAEDAVEAVMKLVNG